MIILRLLLLLTNLHLKLLSTQGTGADKLLSTQRVKLKDVIDHFASFEATDAYHKLLSANNSSDTTDVNRIKKTHHKNKSSSSTNFINCYSCGSNHKYGDCPAYGHI